MKILQLNVWMGKVEGNLGRFLENNNFDVICLQEVMYSEDCETHLSRLCFDASRIIKVSGMPYYYFSPNWSSKIADGSFELGNMILSKIPFTTEQSHFVNGEYITETILGMSPANNLNVQIVELENGITVVNHHGFWRPSPVGDADTVKAFSKLAEIIKPYNKTPLVMCGDLNIVHEAPAMRNLDFLRDLTFENSIKTTLSGLKFNGEVPCDHILINDKMEAIDFTVHPDLVSDHLALSAEVRVKDRWRTKT